MVVAQRLLQQCHYRRILRHEIAELLHRQLLADAAIVCRRVDTAASRCRTVSIQRQFVEQRRRRLGAAFVREIPNLFQNDGEQRFGSLTDAHRRGSQFFFVLQANRFTRFANAFRPGNAELHHFQHRGQAVLVVQQVGVLHQPGRAALERRHDGAVQVFAVRLARPLALVENVVANPFDGAFAFERI